MENFEKLEEKISNGLDELDPSKDGYNEKVKAVKDLYELKIQEEKVNNDYYCKATELSNEQFKNDHSTHWWNKIDPNTIITTIAMGAGTLLTLKSQQDGYLIRPDGFLSNLIHRNK